MSAFRQIQAMAEASIADDPQGLVLPGRIVDEMVSEGVARAEIEQILGTGAAATPVDVLSPEQSERAARLAHAVALAERVFASREKAFLWLRMPSDELEGRTPFAYLTTETGARFVEEMLIRIDHGIAA